VTPVGANRPVAVDLRLVTATLRDLHAQVDDGGFRPDLFARISGYAMEMPPLRDRREDLGLLVADLVRRAAGANAGAVTFTVSAVRALLRHDWPMNIRELGRAIETALALSRGRPIDEAHLPAAVRGESSGPARIALEPDDERVRILRALDQCGGNQSEAARVLGIPRRTLLRRLDEHGITRPRKSRDS
jgi:DNA-binding NtrC family response regulator